MKPWGVIIAIFMTCFQASAQTIELPSAWPAQLGSVGSAFRVGSVPEGSWLAWSYMRNGQRRIAAVCAITGYTIIHPPTDGMTPIRTARAYWEANVRTSCATDPRMSAIYNDMRRAMQ